MLLYRSADGRTAVMLEINSETDFVARDENFTGFADNGCRNSTRGSIADVDALANETLIGTNITVEQSKTRR